MSPAEELPSAELSLGASAALFSFTVFSCVPSWGVGARMTGSGTSLLLPKCVRVPLPVAASSKGYIYAISRDGVTGTEKESETLGLDEVVANVARFGGAPVLLGFGISTPEHVAAAIKAGAAGAITGSALTKIIEKHLVTIDEEAGTTRVEDLDALAKDVTEFVSAMKAGTR